jgi:hypothetical protein
MAAIAIVVDPASLKREASGNVVGALALRGEAAEFPMAGWFDFPVVVLAWWIQGLFELSSGTSESFQGLFMEGPYAFTVRTDAGGVAAVAWGHRGNEVPVGTMPLQDLLQSAVCAGEMVAEACRAQKWRNSDLNHLEEALARTSV